MGGYIVSLNLAFNDEPGKVEKHFRQFLARDNFSKGPSANSTVKKAQAKFRKIRNDVHVIKQLTDAWNELSDSQQALEDLINRLAGSKDILATEEQIKNFLAKAGSLTNQMPSTQSTLKSEG